MGPRGLVGWPPSVVGWAVPEDELFDIVGHLGGANGSEKIRF